ncbi:glycosyltransferase family 2 protein [Acidithiobacillus ferrivorans]|nr:glycosyltransferase [Acidithiobacillus ferrivorans]
MSAQKYAVIIPILNGGKVWVECVKALQQQMPQPDQVLVIDSGSEDGSDDAAVNAGFTLIRISKETFDHGGTRQMAFGILQDYELLVFLTQDAVLAAPDSLAHLLLPFADPMMGATTGRQLPRLIAGPIEAHARIFGYPTQSNTRTIADRGRLGIKAASISNSFAAYRRSALFEVGGFPQKLILGEDMIVAARLLQAGYTLAYVGDAKVYHSHNYTIWQEFKRYFDTGVMHDDQPWLIKDFGKPEGEGLRFIKSEGRYLLKNAPWLLPSTMLRTLAKYGGYKLGLKAKKMPLFLRIKFSMFRHYWDE